VRIALVVFDMVGTTVQAGDEVPSSFREAFRSVGITLSGEEVSRVRGRSKRDAISYLLATRLEDPLTNAEQAESVYAHFLETLRAAYRAGARAIPGAEEVMCSLRRAEIEVVLTTGLDRETAQLLVKGLDWDSLGLRGVVTGDDVCRGRPAPDLIHSAMAMANVEDARSVVAVGDTSSDLEAGAAAKVGWSVGVLTGAHSRTQLEAHPHSVILESVRSLPRWLGEVGAL
jgi:phosphonatase-like hydrolase